MLQFINTLYKNKISLERLEPSRKKKKIYYSFSHFIFKKLLAQWSNISEIQLKNDFCFAPTFGKPPPLKYWLPQMEFFLGILTHT